MSERPDDLRTSADTLRQTYSPGTPGETPAPTTRKAQRSTRDHFSDSMIPAQFKLPDDLVASLKLHSIATGKTMSEIVLQTLTTPATISKAWISTKRAA